jgi:hypothetical protein
MSGDFLRASLLALFMPEANIAKRTDLMNYFMRGKSEHESGGHIFEPTPSCECDNKRASLNRTDVAFPL